MSVASSYIIDIIDNPFKRDEMSEVGLTWMGAVALSIDRLRREFRFVSFALTQ